jgi:hypothetical protein
LLGPSVLFASPPFCTAYALHACALAKAKTAARIGLVLAGIELVFLILLIIMSLPQVTGG